MRRFFVPPELLTGPTTRISGELFRHLATVLRLKEGETVRLADGRGGEFLATITALDREGMAMALAAAETCSPAAGFPAITLYQGLPKGEDKIDLILQKATELGAAELVPFMAARSVPKLAGEKLAKRLVRWQRIIQEAARQSEGETIPRLTFGADLTAVLQRQSHDLQLLFWEGEKQQGLKDALSGSAKPASIGIIVGPEGGLTCQEVAVAQAAGYLPISLGKRILRTETAGLAVLAILQYCWGDLG
jgi:16S rRNA (uracil1498-N3)-methyltransferase